MVRMVPAVQMLAPEQQVLGQPGVLARGHQRQAQKHSLEWVGSVCLANLPGLVAWERLVE